MAASAIALFVLGAIVASFVTVLAHRLPRGEGFVTGRSRCPRCGAPIGARDNLPVLSWLWLRGRCRACGEPISVRYPVAELGLGALWVLTFLIVGDEDLAELGLGLLLCAVLVAITLTDLDLGLIPNAIVLPAAVAGLGLAALVDPPELGERLIAALVGGGALFALALAYPRGLGMGDAKLVGMMGIYLGRALIPAFLVALLAGALVGGALIARHGSGARKRAVPFGPFLALGGIVGLWFGAEIVDWYDERFLSPE